MTVTGILSAIVVGLVIGALGRLVLPGKQKIGLLLTLLVGVVAALVGSLLASFLVPDTSGFNIVELIVQVVLAAIGVSLVAGSASRSRD